MRLLVGLGNPGARYARTRHNIGFMAVDEIVRRHGFGPWRARFQGKCAEGTVAGEKILALKPETWMNHSGRAVGEAVRFFKIEPAQVIVLHDEIDLAAGKIRFKIGGGNAGHNGLRDIDAHIGRDYARVRLGVGHPGVADDVHDHVLDEFSKADMAWVTPLVAAVAEAFPLLAGDDGARFLTRVALILNPPPPKPPHPRATDDDAPKDT
ncbi:MAG: aminoacyl-tRNA hydrolase [Alphaproteobacteria bacterium]|nr:aminoacyl-tRNA hydrolase [Alphaproteobacteria bacterium]